MNMDGSSKCAGKDGAKSCVEHFVNILLVDHDTTSLMSIASRLEHQHYNVTSIESATVALSMFHQLNNYFDIVIADINMPEMEISEFVEKLHVHPMTVPVILIVEDSKIHSAMDALGGQVCYYFSKPPSHRDVSNVWVHIHRVTGNMPPSSEKIKYIDIEKDCNPSSAAINQKQKNLKINNDKENTKRKNDQIAETTSASSVKSKKPRITWDSNLHQKFLKAISVLGEQRAKPKTILSLMGEPNLTARHVSSHLQNYKNHREQFMNLENEQSLNLHKEASPVEPTLFSGAQTNDTVSLDIIATPNSMQVQNLDTFNYSGENNVNTIINNDASKNAENLAEGTNASHQQFDEMPSDDEVNQLLQELEASGFNI